MGVRWEVLATLVYGITMTSPVPGFNAKIANVARVGGSYSYDAKRKYLISYDTPEKIAALKAEYVQCLGLAGTAYWEVSMDPNDSLSLHRHYYLSVWGG